MAAQSTVSKNNGALPTFLKDPEDWDSWKENFISKAGDLWPVITGEVPPKPRPTVPTIAACFPQVLNDGEQPDAISENTLFSRLTATMRLQWDNRNRTYDRRRKEYDREHQAIQTLRDWVHEHLDQDTSCCPANQSIATWWENLQTFFDRSSKQIRVKLIRKYMEVVSQPLVEKEEATVRAWIAKWEEVMKKMEARNFKEYLNPEIWLTNLCDAIHQAFPMWSMAADKTFSPKQGGRNTWRARINSNQFLIRLFE